MESVQNSLNLQAPQELLELGHRLRDSLARVAGDMLPEGFTQLYTTLMASVLQSGCRTAGADAVGIWLADSEEDQLALMSGHGGRVEECVGEYKQPLSSGLISMVYATGQAFCENEIQGRPGHSPVLDELLGVKTQAMIAVPFYFAQHIRGVVSFVQLSEREDESAQARGFSQSDLREVKLATASVQKLLDLRLIEHLLGWNDQ